MQNVTRRDFIGTAAVAGMATAAVAGFSAGMALADEAEPAWAASYDVVVCGLGMAGIAAAIDAARAGARVLAVEKCNPDFAGGCTRYSGQGILNIKPQDRDTVLEYFKQARGFESEPSDLWLERYVDGLIEAPEWFGSIGGEPVLVVDGVGYHPEVEGWDMLGSWAHKGIYWVGMYQQFRDGLAAQEGVDTWFEAPAKRLVQATDGTIEGVVVEVAGNEVAVQATRGVILATGGFEASNKMTYDYVQLPWCYCMGGFFNTGDGIAMAQRVGADLWHMGYTQTEVAAISPEHSLIPGFCFDGGAFNAVNGGVFGSGAIAVDAQGKRYCNEAEGLGMVSWVGVQVHSFVICDADAIRVTIYTAWDVDEKIADGTIVEAATLDELAEKLGLPQGSLPETVAGYNAWCDLGADGDFGRAAEMLTPLAEEGPYYGFEINPMYVHTYGGPRRDEDCRVLDVDGQPIPHLYAVGECGSMFTECEAGGALGECIVSGRIAGANAAAADPLPTAEIAEPADFTASGIQTIDVDLAENERLGTAYGIGGLLGVKLTLDGKTITGFDVVRHNETPGIGTKAIEIVPAEIFAAGTLDVDAVTGATSTSRALIEAARNALEA